MTINTPINQSVPALAGEVVIRSVPVTGRYRITGRVHRPVGYLTQVRQRHTVHVDPRVHHVMGNTVQRRPEQVRHFREDRLGDE